MKFIRKMFVSAALISLPLTMAVAEGEAEYERARGFVQWLDSAIDYVAAREASFHQEIADLGLDVAALEAFRDKLLADLDARDVTIAAKDAEIAERDAAIADRDSTIADRDATIHDQGVVILSWQERYGLLHAAITQVADDHRPELDEGEKPQDGDGSGE